MISVCTLHPSQCGSEVECSSPVFTIVSTNRVTQYLSRDPIWCRYSAPYVSRRILQPQSMACPSLALTNYFFYSSVHSRLQGWRHQYSPQPSLLLSPKCRHQGLHLGLMRGTQLPSWRNVLQWSDSSTILCSSPNTASPPFIPCHQQCPIVQGHGCFFNNWCSVTVISHPECRRILALK